MQIPPSPPNPESCGRISLRLSSGSTAQLLIKTAIDVATRKTIKPRSHCVSMAHSVYSSVWQSTPFGMEGSSVRVTLYGPIMMLGMIWQMEPLLHWVFILAPAIDYVLVAGVFTLRFIIISPLLFIPLRRDFFFCLQSKISPCIVQQLTKHTRE